MNKIKLIIGTVIFFAVLHGIIALENFNLNHDSVTGNMIENNIDMPEFDDIFVPSKGK